MQRAWADENVQKRGDWHIQRMFVPQLRPLPALQYQTFTRRGRPDRSISLDVARALDERRTDAQGSLGLVGREDICFQ